MIYQSLHILIFDFKNLNFSIPNIIFLISPPWIYLVVIHPPSQGCVCVGGVGELLPLGCSAQLLTKVRWKNEMGVLINC